MPNRIIKSLDCRKIISIFCILEVDWAVPVCVFTIPVITLFVVFDESFQKALVDKSVCVINIAHLIVLSSTNNPLFDANFNRHCTSCRFAFTCHEGRFGTRRTLCRFSFPCHESIFGTLRTFCSIALACHGRIFEVLCTLCMFAFACHESIFGILRNLCSKIFACHESIFETLRTLCSDICIFHVRKNISDISLFGFRRLYLFFFPFLYKTKI